MTTSIYEERIRRAWTQKRLAFEAGIDARTLRKIEKGQSVSLDTLRTVCAALEIDPSDLTVEEENAETAVHVTDKNPSAGFLVISAFAFAALGIIGSLNSEWLFPVIAAFLSAIGIGLAIWDAPGIRKTRGLLSGAFLTLTGLMWLTNLEYLFRTEVIGHYDHSWAVAYIILGYGLICLVPPVSEKVFPFKGSPDVAFRRLFLTIFGISVYACPENLFYAITANKHLFRMLSSGVWPTPMHTLGNYFPWMVAAAVLITFRSKSRLIPLLMIFGIFRREVWHLTIMWGASFSDWVFFVFYNGLDTAMLVIGTAITRKNWTRPMQPLSRVFKRSTAIGNTLRVWADLIIRPNNQRLPLRHA